MGGAFLSTKPPLEPTGTMTVFLTCWALTSPRTSVRKSSRRSDQRSPPRATLPAAQVHALHARGIHPDFEQRLGLGHARHFARIELEAQVRFGQAVGRALARNWCASRTDGGYKLAQDAVFVQAGHLGQLRSRCCCASACSRCARSSSSAGSKRVMNSAAMAWASCGVVAQRGLNVALAVGKTQLFEVAGVGAQHGDGARVQMWWPAPGG